MHAVRYREGGDPTVLHLEEIERPTPTRNELLVNVQAASVNPADAKRRIRGAGPLPKTTGSDFAGVIEAVGDGVDHFNIGDRVCGTGLHLYQQGSFAEYLTVPVELAVKLPDAVSFREGAAVALVGVTAWRALLDHGNLTPAETCLIHGGTGGVGHIAVQLANIVGAYTVTTVGSDHAEERAIEFGADAVVRYQDPDLVESLRESAQDGFDVTVDHRVHDYLQVDLEVAATAGRIIHIGGEDTYFTDPRVGRRKELTIHMMNMANTITEKDLPSMSGILRRLLELIERGSLRPEIARAYDLEEAPEAHRAVMEDSFVGKIVVEP